MAPTERVDAARVRAWATALASPGHDLSDVERIDLIRALEQLKCVSEAAQATISVDFDASQRAEQADRGVPAAQQGRGVAEQIALARRESPHRGRQHLGLAKILLKELPRTRAAFAGGRIGEWKVTLVARETACLSLEDRLRVDAELAGNPERIEAMGDGELVAEARKLAYELDPAAFVERRRHADADRRVTLRPAPDVMSQLSALLPVKDGVAVYAALTREADRLRASGDRRSRGQIMADTLVLRVLGGGSCATGGEVGVMINLIVSDRVLWGDSDEAGYVDGYGPVPADLARELAGTVGAWLRRLYVSPETGSLVAMDSAARIVPAKLGQLFRLRDKTCRTPWCDAPIRHHDHVRAVAEGGETSEPNGQGLCEACNYAKEAFGWAARPRPGPRHTVETTTPTGHRYESTAPPLTQPSFVEARPGVWTLVA
ncbi:MAG: hypothetical protein JWM79_2031 [Nocardioides sp.]|nr:hypothetical protein [Nocardioides sp.]